MRHVSAETFTDEFFGSIAVEFRLLWIGLIAAVADDQGRFPDNAALIRSMIFPYDEKITIKAIDQGLTLLAKSHKIDRYMAGTNGSGKRLIQIVNWWKYQHSTQWAQKSIYPAPPKWQDRVRIHITGNGNVPYLLNWDCEGGYVQATKKLRKSFKGDRPIPRPRPTPKPRPTPRPTSNPKAAQGTRSARKAGGGGGDQKVDAALDEIKKTNPNAAETIRIMKPILTASGLGKEIFNKTMLQVATRILPREAKRYVLGALASAFADESVIKKPVVAAYRMENNQVPAQYMDEGMWHFIPDAILDKANVTLPAGKSQSKVSHAIFNKPA